MQPWPRQPFVGLGLAALLGILVADWSPHDSLGLGLFLVLATIAWARRSSLLVYFTAALAFFFLHSAASAELARARTRSEVGRATPSHVR